MSRAKRADRATLEAAAQLLRETVTDAIFTLCDIMKDPSNAAGARSQAAAQILNSCLKYSEYAELEQRIARLELLQQESNESNIA